MISIICEIRELRVYWLLNATIINDNIKRRRERQETKVNSLLFLFLSSFFLS